MTDSLFSPARFAMGSNSIWRNTYLMREDFRNLGGLRWQSGEGSEAGRKSASRSLERAQSAGLAKKLNPSGSKSPTVRLTDSGEEFARYLCAVSTPEDDLKLIKKLERLCQRSPNAYIDSTDGETAWILEGNLVGLKHNQPSEKEFAQQLWFAQLKLASATRRGWVESTSDMTGCIFFRTTQKWRQEKPARYQRVNRSAPPDFEVELREKYFDGFDEMTEILETTQHKKTGEIGPIPLSAGMYQRRDRSKE